MRAAPGPRREARLLVIDPELGRWGDARVADLPTLLAPGDLVVVNDAATLPAALFGSAQGTPIELRLLAAPDLATGLATAVIFGAGDWRTPTERRPPPPPLPVGTRLVFGDLGAGVVATDPRSERLVHLRFDRVGGPLLHALYTHGRPVQYSYLAHDVPLDAVQTPFAGRPWAMEMPSASRALTPAVLAALRSNGVAIATLTHAAGLSATGDDALDALLPLPERYEIPVATVEAIRLAHARGGRVIAMGTTVLRALEGAARAPGGLAAGVGVTDLVVDAGVRMRVVDGLVSGVHVPGESHYRVLAGIAPTDLLEGAIAHAEAGGYLAHEFGDGTLMLRGVLAGRRRRAA